MKKTIIFLFAVVLVISCKTNEEKSETNKNAKNIILLIGDGMGVAHLHAAMTVTPDALNIEKLPHVGLIKTNSSDNYITDSAAGGTAISSGVKTTNGAVGVDSTGNLVKTILEYAEDNQLSTGLVASSSVTHATPASFIAHVTSRSMNEEIASFFLETDVDVFMGGGRQYFSDRKDKLNLLDQLINKGYEVQDTFIETYEPEGNKYAGLYYMNHPPSILNGRGNMLPRSVDIALDKLSGNNSGFFLMIEGSQIDWGGHANDIDFITTEMLDFDKAVGKALDFAEKDGNTLVIVTSDHETGGLAINGGSIRQNMIDPAFTTDGHTGIMVPVFAYGPGAEKFSGIYHNTGIFDKMMESFGFSK